MSLVDAMFLRCRRSSILMGRIASLIEMAFVFLRLISGAKVRGGQLIDRLRMCLASGALTAKTNQVAGALSGSRMDQSSDRGRLNQSQSRLTQEIMARLFIRIKFNHL